MKATASKERPIIFSDEMVRAILSGKKSQTRRIMNPQPEYFEQQPHWRWKPKSLRAVGPFACASGDRPGMFGKYAPGDLLWVRESSFFRSECGGFLSRRVGSGAFEAWTVDGKTHWQWERRESDYPLEWSVGSYSGGQKNGSFTLGLYRCNTRKKIKPFTGNTVIEERSVVFRRKLPAIHMPRWASRITLEITDVRVDRLQDISGEDAIAEGVMRTAETDPAKLDRWEWEQCKQTARFCYSQLWDKINGDGSWDSNPWVWAISFEVIA